MMKKILAAVLAMAMICAAAAVGMRASGTQTVPAGFTPIYTPQDLDNVRYNLSGKFILMNDINLSEWGNWIPIAPGFGEGTTGIYDYFTGVFDGNGYVIKNMTVNREGGYPRAGLFGQARSCTISNLGLVNSSITATATSNAFAGGIAGILEYGSSIYNCYNSSEVLAYSSPIGGSGGAGGIVGQMDSTSAMIANCYNAGPVSFYGAAPGAGFNIEYAGGIAGYSNGTITNCYNAGTVNHGALVGICSSNSKTQNGYYLDNNPKAVGRIQGGTPVITCQRLTDAQMRQQSSFTGFDFADVWMMPTGGGYPVLRAFDKTVTPPTTTTTATTTTTTTTSTTSSTTPTSTTSTTTTTSTTAPTTQPPAKGVFGTNARYNQWYHYIMFFLLLGFIWMW